MTENIRDRVPKCRDLLNPTLAALHALGGSASIREIVNQVIEDMGLSSAITQVPYRGKANRTALEDELGWARTYLRKYGLIDSSERGVWALTAKGHETQHVDPQAVCDSYQQYLEQRQARKQTKTQEDPLAEEIETSTEDPADGTASWREDLLDTIDGELLMDKMKELKLGVSAKMVEVVEVDKDWFASI